MASKVAFRNHYELLDLNPNSSYPEILKAYHAAKNIFSISNPEILKKFSESEVRSLNFLLDEAFEKISLKALAQNKDVVSQKFTPSKTLDSKPSTDSKAELFSLRRNKKDDRRQKDTPSSQNISDKNQDLLVKAEAPQPFLKKNIESGEQLKELRVSLNISLESIHQITKISMIYLRALEKEDYKNLPTDFFLKNYVKQYVQVLKLECSSDIAQNYLRRKNHTNS